MAISAGPDRFTNNWQTTVAAPGITTVGQTTIPITNALGSPNPGPFRILIDNELMQVTGGYGTTTLTVARGVEGTAPNTHIATANVTHDVTAFDFNSFRNEFNVLAYGAKGNGSADDSTAFQNAINDARVLAGGGYIFIPTLAYNIGSILTTYANVVFITYGATFSGAGATSVAPLIKWGLTGALTLGAALTISTGGANITGGLTVVNGLTVSNGSSLIGNTTITPQQASGQNGLLIQPQNVGSVLAETIGVLQSGQTLTITGSYTNQRFFVLNQSTITSASPLTIANAATLAIPGAPVQAGSTTITNKYALWVQGDITKLEGPLYLNANSTNSVPTMGAGATGAVIWIQAGDPGGSAANGDLWFQG
jgi:hypothetical protein